MVMMGQQLMDSERKKEDDEDYVIRPHREQQTQHSSPEKMQREVPTLVSLAKKTVREKNTGNVTFAGDPTKERSEAIRIAGSGDAPREQQQPIQGEAASASLNGNGESSSSGRTSSLGGDSSGIGSSLTCSSSSEPIERDALSPSSDHGGNGDSAEDVPDNRAGEGDADASINLDPIPVNDDDDEDGESCQVLMLTEEYDGQMTAAKKFLKIIREGIKEGEEDCPTTSATPVRAAAVKAAELSETDEDTPTTMKSVILKSINSNSILHKEKSIIGSGLSSRPMSKSIGAAAQQLSLSNGITQQHILEKGPPPSCVQEVWAHNLLEEFAKIRRVVKIFNFIAMDTEFPGIVVRPQSSVRVGGGVFPYELLKGNVDRLKIIQLGVTFMDRYGKTPPGVCTWQFNFKFSLNKDIYAPDSISLLTRCGIQFEKHAEMGINPETFGEYFMSSGMVTSDQVTYLTFHSGFHFGYLIKLLSNLPLPENEEKFFEIMKIYFPNVYDLKYLMKSVDLHGGLQDIANQLGQERVGTQHQAGSDSLLTGMTFFKLLNTDVFNGEMDELKYCGKLYGFHISPEDGRDDGWSEIPGDILDPTSPKPLQSSRSSNLNTNASYSGTNGTHLLPSQHPSAGTTGNAINGDSNNR